jgi:hypothetical protein
MSKKVNKKQRDLSIRLKTSFAVQTHIEELVYLRQKISDTGVEGQEEFLELMEDVLAESLLIIFPKPFEA